jgi:hypothetical protein
VTDQLRKVPLIIAFGLILVVVALELGSAAFLKGAASSTQAARTAADAGLGGHVAAAQAVGDAAQQDEPPGLGIPYLALVDGIVAYSLGLMLLALVIPDHLQAKVQGIVSLILSILLALGSMALILAALAKLFIMVGLFFAPPFGTIAYLAIWGGFPKTAAAVILSLIMTLKVAAAVCLPIAHQRFLNDKGLILLVLTSLLATIIVSFLHGLVPFALVSITDAVAAIIVGILALIWAVVILIGAINAVVQALLTS